MPFNGSGTFQRTQDWTNDAAANIKIRADRHDSNDDDIAAGLSNCITKDGQTTVTADIPLNGHKLTNLGAPANPNDAARKTDVDGKVAKAGDTMTGTLNIIPASGGASLVLDAAAAAGALVTVDGNAGQASGLLAKVAGVMRWAMYLGNGNAESGGNAGSDFSLYRFTDAGAAIDVPIGISRANGQVTMPNQLNVNNSIVIGGSGNMLVPAAGNYYLNGSINWVRQGHLVTGFSSQNTTATVAILVLPGGQYGFAPVIYGNANVVHIGSAQSPTFASSAAGANLVAQQTNTSAASTQYVLIGQGPTAGASTIYADQRYVTASPPYDMGDGEIPLWLYALVDNASGEVIGASASSDPPWAYNGPDRIIVNEYIEGKPFELIRDVDLTGLSPRDAVEAFAAAPVKLVEVDMERKLRGMRSIPHPWISDPAFLDGTATPVLLDPVAPVMEKLAAWHQPGNQSVLDLLHKDGKPAALKIGNTALKRAGPQGVLVVSADWR